MRYHWVMPEEKAEPASQVIRVLGEKGERYETVYAEDSLAALKQNPAIQEAMLARQAALRKEAMELARELREAGKEPLVAYEEAWTQVYSRSWLSGGWLSGSCKLEDMLRSAPYPVKTAAVSLQLRLGNIEEIEPVLLNCHYLRRGKGTGL